MSTRQLVSIIIPVYNDAQHLDQCIAAVKRSSYPSFEIIVIDDGSTDASSQVARNHGAFVFQLQRQSGPAAARNYGAKKAKGDILLFIDADVLVQEETIARVVYDFEEHPEIGALFGSYDDDPFEKNFFSQYKNLLHHYVHQISSREAVTFWAGCGAVRKEIFHIVGGFDETKYLRPCIEDIELGYRLRKSGYQILLDKEIQVKHLKKWNLKSLIRTDIFNRAIPWSKLILENQEMVSDLNLQTSQKLGTGLMGVVILILPISLLMPKLLYLAAFLLVTIFFINHKLFSFFFSRKGVQFTIIAFAMYMLYYIYSGASYASCWLQHKVQK